jgi:isocitrate/isopropylmalate dehydrogenase
MRTFTIAVIAGDGAGMEVVPRAKRVLEKSATKHAVLEKLSW